MKTTTDIRWGPEFTPTLIRQLILLTCGISLTAAFSEPMLRILFGLPGLSYLLSLSWYGIKNYYLWQVLTFLFIENSYGAGPSFSFLIALGFSMYLLWVMGSDLLERIGQAAFLRFYFFTGISAGLAALLVMELTGMRTILSGSAPAILGLVTAWTLFNPEFELLFFFILRIKAKWLWAILVAATLLNPLTHLDWVSLAFYASPIILGYLYAITAWNLSAPFAWLRPLDSSLSFLKRSSRKISNWGKSRDEKIINFSTGETLQDDNRFVDAMLEKISKKGESSLTWKERQRLQAISKQKNKKS